MLKRLQVQVLCQANLPHAEVSRLSGVSAREVRRIIAEPGVSHVDDMTERRRRRIGRPSKAEPFRSYVTGLLETEPDIMSLEILRRVKLDGYEGSKSALYAMIAGLRPPKQKPIVRFEGLPGEFSQHDFGQVDVRYLNDSKERIHFFASRLKFSRSVQVTIVPNEQVESVVRPLVDHFAAFGGVPLQAVFDRPKTIAQKWRHDGTVTDWNATFAQVVVDLGIGVELCWPHSPWQKGAVENLVGWVKGSFFKQRRFIDRDDLLRQLQEWLHAVNHETPCRATGEIPATLLQKELARLRPLKVDPDELALRYPVVVGPTAMVLHDTHGYSMPPEAIGIAGTLFLYKDKVRIVAGRHEADHPRLFEHKAKSVLPSHRASLVAAVSGKRAKRYYKRQQILDLGDCALSYLTEIIHRRPGAWIRDVDKLFDILQQHGDEITRNAIEQALTDGVFGAEYVAHYLGHARSSQQEFWP